MERPFRETFGSLGFQRSNRVKTMEPCRLFLNVSFYRKKVSADELCSLLIFIKLGIQPSAGSSGQEPR
jgi:hypothetical protein